MTEPSTAAKEQAGEIVCAWQADSRGINNLVKRIARALDDKDAALDQALTPIEAGRGTLRGHITALEAELAEAERERDFFLRALAAIDRALSAARGRS